MSNEAAQTEEVRIFMPENNLKKKAGDGGINTSDIKKAEKRVEEIAEDFPSIAEKDLMRIKDWLYEADQGKNLEKAKQNIQSAAFELKSSGGMFDYHIISDVAKSLFDYCDALEKLNSTAIAVVRLHYNMLRALMKKYGKSASNDLRLEVKDMFGALTDKMLKKAGRKRLE